MNIEISSRKTKVDRRKKERRKIPCFIDKERRSEDRRNQYKKRKRREFERHLRAQR